MILNKKNSFDSQLVGDRVKAKGLWVVAYAYVEAGIAEDFWTLLKQEWIDTGHFA